MTRTALEFLTIDVAQHFPLCVQFSEDMFQCSFGTVERFRGTDGRGQQRYQEALLRNTLQDPSGHVHAWREGEIMGQIEVGRFWEDPSAGFLYFLYVVAPYRGTGIASELDNYITDYFRHRGLRTAYLLVSPANVRAVRFYLKQGWQDLGAYERDKANHLMRKTYAQ